MSADKDKDIQTLLYESGDRDMRDHLFRRATGILLFEWDDPGYTEVCKNPKYIEPIYIICRQLNCLEDECCLRCFGDCHAGDYDNSQGRPERQYIESKHGLIIFYCCCDHQDIKNLLKILDDFIENKS